jgi:hypothetical protein
MVVVVVVWYPTTSMYIPYYTAPLEPFVYGATHKKVFPVRYQMVLKEKLLLAVTFRTSGISSIPVT